MLTPVIDDCFLKMHMWLPEFTANGFSVRSPVVHYIQYGAKVLCTSDV